MFRKALKLGWYWTFFSVLIPALTGCELPAELKEGASSIKLNEKSTTPGNAVCNPFGSDASAGVGHGLKADIYYLDPNLPHFNHVSDYISQGTKVNADAYFDQLNVPTRPFDKGFITTDGKVMTTPAGDTLYEWFALEFETILRLTNQDSPNRMQFALIADDGAVLEQKVGNDWVTVVNNDGTHGTKFKVATSPVTMDAQSRLPLRIRYYQGPRYHIAVMLMWRVWPENGSDWQDPLDGFTSNTAYFDPTTTPSTPQPAYQSLLARGWKPIPSSNFYLPETVVENPCPPVDIVDPPVDPVIPGTFALTAFDGITSADTAFLIWQTAGFPASGKVYWGTAPDQLTNTVNESTNGNTSHQVQVTGLQGATLYYFQAESTDANGNTLRSTIITKTTK